MCTFADRRLVRVFSPYQHGDVIVSVPAEAAEQMVQGGVGEYADAPTAQTIRPPENAMLRPAEGR
jgi:hypothetical protein